MRRTCVLAVAIIWVLLLFSGCTNNPAEKISGIPIVILDFIPDSSTTRIYVHGMTAHRYECIRISVDNRTYLDNSTLYLGINVTDTDFELSVMVHNREDLYETSIHVRVLPEPDVVFDILDEGHRTRVSLEDLPWMKRLERA